MDSCALRAAAEQLWVHLPEVSAREVAWALRQVGFQAHLAGPDHLAITRDRVDVVYLPLRGTIHPRMLRASLRTLGVSVEAFVSGLDAPAPLSSTGE